MRTPHAIAGTDLLATQAEFCRETVASLYSFAGAALQARDPLQLVSLQAGLLAGMAERALLLGQRTAWLALGRWPGVQALAVRQQEPPCP